MWKTSHQYFIKMTEIFENYDVYTGFYRIKNKFSITSIFKKKIRKFFGWKAGLKFFLETKVKYSRLKTGHWKLPSNFLDGKLGWWSFYVWPIVHLPRPLDQKPATWPTCVRVSFWKILDFNKTSLISSGSIMFTLGLGPTHVKKFFPACLCHYWIVLVLDCF